MLNSIEINQPKSTGVEQGITGQNYVAVVVLGYGNIGKQFVEILQRNYKLINEQAKESFKLVAVANSRFYQYNPMGILDVNIESNIQSLSNQCNKQEQVFDELVNLVKQKTVVVDLTASEGISQKYLRFAENGWHIISANKLAAADAKFAESIEHCLKSQNRKWLKNTTVGAALPVQASIKNIRASGDQVRKITGVFSGSLSWLLGQYDGKVEFMQWVKQAHENAYTEPDPREDLSGQDVYRKALILARESGLEPKHVVFEPVIPAEYLAGTVDDFWNNQEVINSYMKCLWVEAEKKGQKLCYLASVSADELRVELVAVDKKHTAAGLKPGDNIFIIESNWYNENPLVIQGPGAGREVTAAGVLTDLIEVLQFA